MYVPAALGFRIVLSRNPQELATGSAEVQF